MAKTFSSSSFFILFAITSIYIHNIHSEDRKVYIVYMGALPENDYSPLAHHESVLEQVLERSEASQSLVYSYGKSFNGFAARLTYSEQQKLLGEKGIISVFPSNKLKVHTTRSWDFIAFPENVKRIPQVESNVIVGILDTGITPTSESFRDEGFGPPPKKWKGSCNGGINFTCNNKLIGARFYSGQTSAIDINGHGTHTASTAAGNQVKNASFYGIGKGIARGAVPWARIAVYRTCGDDGYCSDVDVLAAFDDAISDGVDILSLSLGGDRHDLPFNSIAIGSFHALQKRILTVQSAGNNGPILATLGSVTPWVVTVAASSTDRKIVDKVLLGDGASFLGNGVNSFSLKGEKYPLIYGGDAASSDCAPSAAGNCAVGCLNSTLVKGKIVYCNTSSKGQEPFQNTAVGALLLQDKVFKDVSFVYPLPASSLNSTSGEKILSYIKTTEQPEASIFKSEELNDSSAPVVASFSSRGPNTIVPEILKPDVTAPGVDILAAWPPLSPPSGVGGDTRSVSYNILSGTSMACPHVTGAAAYVKTFHPDWSPSAIKSALMTTAFPLNATKNPDGEFAYGAGHIDPVNAVNPGLVYEALESDYINMLCSIYILKRMLD